jgi:hypothetical protein
MAEWWPFARSWAEEWKRNWSDVLSASQAAAQSLGLPAPEILPADPFAMIVDAARAWLIGKSRTIRFSGHEVILALTDLSVEGEDLARAMGQYGQVRITARDVQWDGYQLARMEITARNAHLRPGTRPTLVVAPVLVEAFVPASAASRWLATVSPRLELTLHAGFPEIGLPGAPWARLEVEADAEGRSILIRPRALHVRGRRVSLRSPAFRMSRHKLPGGIMLTSVEAAPGGFVVRGMLGEWQRSLARTDIERLLSLMRSGKDRLDI